ncbi:hypothetical protein [Actinocrispum wychmicini]|uniref:Uncharacterized protein n=1 Tax=Actinocrispum wychmicini TaxID=1213861 RepID=A0A4R2J4W4_9PSEU|nr:hypothetical protein [Actinocrispum wychmicini]TCO52332.1 hypothetical protein EV192_11263 [Actinocrispum wychmicini]
MTATHIGLAGTRIDGDTHWCPGCGDFAALDTVQAVLPTLGLERDKIVLFSGIGCTRFTHHRIIDGMHVVHGQGPAVVSELATSRLDLSVWVVIRDGHTMTAGGNHLIDSLRSNVNVKVLLYDTQPDPLAVGCEITFLGRAADSDLAALTEVLSRAARHRGSALVQVRPDGQVISPAGVLRQVHRPVPGSAGAGADFTALFTGSN